MEPSAGETRNHVDELSRILEQLFSPFRGKSSSKYLFLLTTATNARDTHPGLLVYMQYKESEASRIGWMPASHAISVPLKKEGDRTRRKAECLCSQRNSLRHGTAHGVFISGPSIRLHRKMQLRGQGQDPAVTTSVVNVLWDSSLVYCQASTVRGFENVSRNRK